MEQIIQCGSHTTARHYPIWVSGVGDVEKTLDIEFPFHIHDYTGLAIAKFASASDAMSFFYSNVALYDSEGQLKGI